jgi:uncharacterized membrane protein YuzA (DUF378 family)
MNMYYKKMVIALSMLLLVIGGLNWGYVAFFGKDFVTFLLGKGMFTNAIFLAVGLAALGLAFYRDTYLPFLGKTILPCDLLQVHTPENADFERRVFVSPGVKVLYWAAEPANTDLQTLVDYKKAYLGYRNAGVAVADNDGFVSLRVRKPQPYQVPLKGELHAHIHYRVCYGDGFLGRVETVGVDGTEWFENVRTEETPEPISEPEIMLPESSKSVDELNLVVSNTNLKSLMPSSGAPDESPSSGGYPIDEAYRPAVPISFTTINYA